MDAQIAVIAFIGFSVASLVVILVSLFGTKEKTYEDALAEQREYTNALLGTQTRPKSKDKKQKKTGKKVKEKQSTPSAAVETVEVSENAETAPSEPNPLPNSQKANLHVEFQKPTIIEVSTEEIPHVPSKPKHNKRARPILVQKEEPKENPVIQDIVDVPPANNFEKIHPKDEFELIRSQSRSRENSASRQDVSKEKIKQNTSDPGTSKETKSKIEQEPTKEKSTKAKQNQEVQQEAVKDKPKEKQNDHQKTKKANKQKDVTNIQVEKEKETNQEDSPTVVEVVEVTSVQSTPAQSSPSQHNTKDKKKKKNETNLIQQITGSSGELNVQLLLDAVRTAELSRSEVQIFIDLLLNKQHDATMDSEWSEGKADPIQKLKKQLAEKEKLLAEEQEALLGAQAKLREVRAEQQTEKSQQQQRIRSLEDALQAKHLELQAANNRFHTQNQKMQQLQAQLNEEVVTVHKLREEQASWAVRLTQAQDAESTVVQLRNDLQELQNRNNQLTIELHTLNEQSMAAKDHQQNVIVQLQHQLTCFKNEIDQKDEYIRQLEESRRDFEHHINIAHRQENELKVEVSQLKAAIQQQSEEVRCLELEKRQVVEDIKKIESQKDELEKNIKELNNTVVERDSQLEALQIRLEDLQTTQQNLLSKEIKEYQDQIKNLQNDLNTVSTDLHENQRNHNEEINTFKNQINNLQIDLNSMRSKNEELETALNEQNTENNTLLKEMEDLKREITRLSDELKEQKNKNDELRQKNWKVVEALNAAENKIKTLLNSSTHTTSEKKLPPKVEQRNVKQQTEEAKKVEKAKNNEEINKLQAQIVHYKSIIDNTEGILKRLELHIEQEELNWRKELKAKESEIEALKEKYFEDLKAKVSDLELQLSKEKASREQLYEKYNSLKNKHMLSDNAGLVEKLSEEVNRLTEQLDAEKKKNLEMQKFSEESLKTQSEISNGCETVQNGTATNGSTPRIVEENLTSSPVSSNASSLNEVTVKRKSKRHRKKKAETQ